MWIHLSFNFLRNINAKVIKQPENRQFYQVARYIFMAVFAVEIIGFTG